MTAPVWMALSAEAHPALLIGGPGGDRRPAGTRRADLLDGRSRGHIRPFAVPSSCEFDKFC